MSYSISSTTLRAAAALALVAVGGVAVDRAARAEPAETPEFCARLDAFDRAMQLRYYNANYAPSQIDCSFIGAQGCTFEAPREIVIRVTHVLDLGCDEDGDCRFLARQVCEADGAALRSCQTLMHAFDAHYEVSGDYTKRADGGWSLDNWRREPAPSIEAAQTRIERVCPAS